MSGSSSSNNPSPARSRWSRVGNAVRRSTSLLSVNRSPTPSGDRDRDSDSVSLGKGRKIDRTPSILLPAESAASLVPSPIAESPLREAEASRMSPLGPSPLAGGIINTSTSTSTKPDTDTKDARAGEDEGSGTNSPPEPVSGLASPTGYVPPPLIESSAGNPGAFTDDPDSLPQPTIIRDPYASGSQSRNRSQVDVGRVEESSRAPSVLGREVSSGGGGGGGLAVGAAAAAAAASAIAAEHSTSSDGLATTNSMASGPGVGGRSFFGKPMVESIYSDGEDGEAGGFAAAVEEHHAGALQVGGGGGGESGAGSSRAGSVRVGPAPVPSPGPEQQLAREVPQQGSVWGRPPQQQQQQQQEQQQQQKRELVIPPPSNPVYQPRPKAPEPASPPEPQFTLPAYVESTGHDVWGGKQPVAQEQSREAGPLDNPFLIPPRIAASQSSAPFAAAPGMPQPQHATVQIQPVESHRDEHPSAAFFPLPPPQSVISAQPLHQMPSTSSYIQSRNQPSGLGYEVDETKPLLSNTGPSRLQPYLSQDPAAASTSLAPWVPSTSSNANAVLLPSRLHDLGWLEYHLPDGSFYYVHPVKRVTTDVNLRVDAVLSDVTSYLENRSGSGAGYSGNGNGYGGTETGNGYGYSAGGGGSVNLSGANNSNLPGVEMWLRDVGTAKKGFVPLKCWVDHHGRTVVVDKDGDGKGKGKKRGTAGVDEGEDQLDMEYRYWSFMEAHPAHTTLPNKARQEAMDVLTWAWTDRLLPSHRAIPAPFTQEECQELMALLRSFNSDNHDDHGIQTRIVSRILLRVALWRQTYFRPSKALPKDIQTNQNLPNRRPRPLRRAFFEFVISIVCLGIPYLFLERARTRGVGAGGADEEGGVAGLRSAGPVFVVGAITCLVAAIVLSASVTFLSLPGLDSIARVAGLVAVLFASLSMASTLVAFFKYKNDVEREVSFVGLEGLVNISNRAVVLSLPLVFLAYSVIGFIVAVVYYTFTPGTSLAGPSSLGLPMTSTFEDYTRWTAVGLLGAVGGILGVTWVAVRR